MHVIICVCLASWFVAWPSSMAETFNVVSTQMVFKHVSFEHLVFLLKNGGGEGGYLKFFTLIIRSKKNLCEVVKDPFKPKSW